MEYYDYFIDDEDDEEEDNDNFIDDIEVIEFENHSLEIVPYCNLPKLGYPFQNLIENMDEDIVLN